MASWRATDCATTAFNKSKIAWDKMVVFTGVEPIALSTQNLRSTIELKYEVSQMHDYLLFVKDYNPLKNLSF